MRHYPKASCNYMVDFEIVSLGSTSMSFKSLLGLNVCVLGDCSWLYFELMYCCYIILFVVFKCSSESMKIQPYEIILTQS